MNPSSPTPRPNASGRGVNFPRPSWCGDSLAIHPRQAERLRRLNLTTFAAFLTLPRAIVSGHPGRQVCPVSLNDGQGILNAYLKIEQRVPFKERLASAWAGFGFTSKSWRESATLNALEEHDLAPRWIAAGESACGQAFVLIEALEGFVPLPRLAMDCPNCWDDWLARRLGDILARMHGLGFTHPDLYAGHVLAHPQNQEIRLIDWQRSWRSPTLSWRARIRDLAALAATLPRAFASDTRQWTFLRSYLGDDPTMPPDELARQIQAVARRLSCRRHVQHKRMQTAPEQSGLFCLAGDSVCVTPGFVRLFPGAVAAEVKRLCERAGLIALPDGSAGLVRRAIHPAPPSRRWISPQRQVMNLAFRLRRHGLVCPEVLAVGEVPDGRGKLEAFVLTRLLPAKLSLPDSAERRRLLLGRLGEVLSRLHRSGCYFRNDSVALGVTPEGAVVIRRLEGLAVVRRGQGRAARADLRDLGAQLLSRGCSRLDLARVVRGYCRWVPGEPSPAGVRPSFRQAMTMMMLQQSPSISPAPCRESFLHRLFRGTRRLIERPDWARFAGEDWADGILDVPVTDRYHAKQGRSTGRLVLRDSGEKLVVYLKRHYRLPRWTGLLACLFPGRNWSPALQECEHLEWARRQGLAVPRVVAAGEMLAPLGKLQSFLAVEELTDMLPLHEAIPLAQRNLSPRDFELWKRSLTAELARVARELHSRNHFHKDLYLCHFYIERRDTARLPGWRGRVFLIDLHRLGHHPWFSLAWQSKDLAQLLYSSDIAGITVRDRLRFWRLYLGQQWKARRRGLLRWLVALRWRRYQAHNARRKARAARELGLAS